MFYRFKKNLLRIMMKFQEILESLIKTFLLRILEIINDRYFKTISTEITEAINLQRIKKIREDYYFFTLFFLLIDFFNVIN